MPAQLHYIYIYIYIYLFQDQKVSVFLFYGLSLEFWYVVANTWFAHFLILLGLKHFSVHITLLSVNVTWVALHSYQKFDDRHLLKTEVFCLNYRYFKYPSTKKKKKEDFARLT